MPNTQNAALRSPAADSWCTCSTEQGRSSRRAPRARRVGPGAGPAGGRCAWESERSSERSAVRGHHTAASSWVIGMARTGIVRPSTSTVARGSLIRLRYQAGSVGIPLFAATTTMSRPSGKYWRTTVRGDPLRRPRVVSSSARRCQRRTTLPRVRRNSHAPSRTECRSMRFSRRVAKLTPGAVRGLRLVIALPFRRCVFRRSSARQKATGCRGRAGRPGNRDRPPSVRGAGLSARFSRALLDLLDTAWCPQSARTLS